MLRLTDEDLKTRHSALCAWLAVLGYILDCMSVAAIRGDVMTRVRRAVERGDVAWPEERHYELTRATYERLTANNAA